MHDVVPAHHASHHPLAYGFMAIYAAGITMSSEVFTAIGALASFGWFVVAASKEVRAWLDRREARKAGRHL